jgi:acyl dehydratase
MERNYYEDYRVGDKFRSPGRTITETDIVLFSSLTGDWWEGHTNVEFAKETMFGQRIAHGLLTLCIGTSLLFRLGDNVFLPRHFIANYGMDRLRFTAPVVIGDTIRCEAELVEKSEKNPNQGILTYEIRILNQRDKQVLVYLEKVLVKRQAVK